MASTCLFVQYLDTLEYQAEVDTRDIRPGHEWGLLGLYVLFLVWIGAETFGVIDWVPSLPPA